MGAIGDFFNLIINVPLGFVLGAIYHVVSSYGIAIILFAIIMKIVLLPLSIKQQKSTIAIQKIAPLQKEIERKYKKSNPQKYQEELSRLYEKEHINPAGGCLPLLIQFPILFGLYAVINQPLTYILGYSQELILKIASLVNIEAAANTLRMKEISIAQAMTSNLEMVSQAVGQTLTPMNFNFLGLNLAEVPSFSHFSVLWIIPIGAGVASYFSQKWMMGVNPAMADNPQAASMNRTMNIMMPLMSVWFGFSLPAGVGVYWIINSVLMPLQQIVLNKIIKPVEKPQKKKKKAIEPTKPTIPEEFLDDLRSARDAEQITLDEIIEETTEENAENEVENESVENEKKPTQSVKPDKYAGYNNSKKKKK